MARASASVSELQFVRDEPQVEAVSDRTPERGAGRIGITVYAPERISEAPKTPEPKRTAQESTLLARLTILRLLSMLLKLIGLIATVGRRFRIGPGNVPGSCPNGDSDRIVCGRPPDDLSSLRFRMTRLNSSRSHSLYTASGQIVLMAIAIVETAGLLFPFDIDALG